MKNRVEVKQTNISLMALETIENIVNEQCKLMDISNAFKINCKYSLNDIIFFDIYNVCLLLSAVVHIPLSVNVNR